MRIYWGFLVKYLATKLIIKRAKAIVEAKAIARAMARARTRVKIYDIARVRVRVLLPLVRTGFEAA